MLTRGEHTCGRDAEAAEGFAGCIVPHMLAPWVADLLALTELRADDRVLDLACGTGLVTTRIPGRAVGLDCNLQMLEVARRQAAPGIQWAQGDAVHLPFAAASFHHVLCQQGLQFFRPREAALAEMHRVLIPGGRVGLLLWGQIEANPYSLALARAMGRHVSDQAERQLRQSFSLSDGKELEVLLRDAGFEEVQVRPLRKSLRLTSLAEFIPGHLAGTSLREVFASLEVDVRAAVIADVVQETKRLLTGDDVVFPFVVQTAVGRRV